MPPNPTKEDLKEFKKGMADFRYIGVRHPTTVYNLTYRCASCSGEYRKESLTKGEAVTVCERGCANPPLWRELLNRLMGRSDYGQGKLIEQKESHVYSDGTKYFAPAGRPYKNVNLKDYY
jgi:hypothetical protein